MLILGRLPLSKNSIRVINWRVFIIEYSPDLSHVLGKNNIVDNALTGLEMINEIKPGTYFT
jgi:hypothetical protein